ncbi:metallophosphoesterase [Massilia arenosa]|uniref:Metallophosphoesterase n=1 Tax=Zemynaea arenosa TaxID=2561931 RepID=A0A4Y9SIY3_9BURK|nr:metallophosphoesterase family protein [Massilia arenosa]TFW20772.1 metallophosphoesterase [Massilia arenosa]
MRLALLTDLHANREALAACLEHARAQKADRYAFTGDFVGYGADPAWVVDTVREYVAQGAIAVQGNHDLSVTQPTRPQMHMEAREVIEWTRGRLDREQLDFLAGLPLTAELDKHFFVHASAHEPQRWAYVDCAEEAEKSLKAARGARIVFSGHVHAPALYRRADDGRMGSHVPLPDVRIPLAPQHQYLVLPGAVGQPRDGNCAACYAIYDDATRELTCFRVPYDHGAAARRVIAAGLPIVFAMRLIEGI